LAPLVSIALPFDGSLHPVRVEAGGTGISSATVWSRALLAQNRSQHASVIPALAKSARAGHPVRWVPTALQRRGHPARTIIGMIRWARGKAGGGVVGQKLGAFKGFKCDLKLR
jgi:hypothetical protein